PSLAAVLERALSLQPNERYADGAELGQALDSVLSPTAGPADDRSSPTLVRDAGHSDTTRVVGPAEASRRVRPPREKEKVGHRRRPVERPTRLLAALGVLA